VSAKCTFHVGHGGGHAALRHDGVRLAEERLADEADGDARRGRLDGGAQPGAARADDEDVVLVSLDLGHQMILQSWMTPVAHRRM
jgi:hypothetical protein